MPCQCGVRIRFNNARQSVVFKNAFYTDKTLLFIGFDDPSKFLATQCCRYAFVSGVAPKAQECKGDLADTAETATAFKQHVAQFNVERIAAFDVFDFGLYLCQHLQTLDFGQCFWKFVINPRDVCATRCLSTAPTPCFQVFIF